jgi:hypothetical protein
MINMNAARLLLQKLIPLKMPIDWWKEIRSMSGIKLEALVPYGVGLSLSENIQSSTNRTMPKEEHAACPLPSLSAFARRAARGVYARVRRIKAQRIVF